MINKIVIPHKQVSRGNPRKLFQKLECEFMGLDMDNIVSIEGVA